MTERESCKHERLNFGSGGYYIFCRDCGAGWMAKERANDTVDYARSSHGLGPDDFRDRPVEPDEGEDVLGLRPGEK